MLWCLVVDLGKVAGVPGGVNQEVDHWKSKPEHEREQAGGAPRCCQVGFHWGVGGPGHLTLWPMLPLLGCGSSKTLPGQARRKRPGSAGTQKLKNRVSFNRPCVGPSRPTLNRAQFVAHPHSPVPGFHSTSARLGLIDRKLILFACFLQLPGDGSFDPPQRPR